jgi:chemotaxis signal transduction protein
MTQHQALHSLARALILVGGIVLLIGAILQVIDVRSLLDLTPNVRSLSLFSSALIAILVGILALIGSTQVSSAVWCIILMVLGYLVGSLGGILVFIGELIGLVATLVKT